MSRPEPVRCAFRLPDLGEGLVSAEVLGWLVTVGDRVTVDQIVVEVETEKTTVELPCPYPGEVAELHAAAGDVLPVGAPLLTVLVPADLAGEAVPVGPSGAVPVGPSGEAVPVGPTGEAVPGTDPDPRRTASPARPDTAAGPVLVGSGPDATSGQLTRHVPAAPPPAARPAVRAAASPAVRRLARELGVDLHLLTGTGPDGLVTRQDVLDSAAAAGEHRD
ncbi:E3 binding domain-containing protein [Micromonospora echinospora]|uniref:E3 binding domain-containing protein n=1 Tax=Micromonospora echinospora TaxID=1877 RepID=UPI003A83C20F